MSASLDGQELFDKHQLEIEAGSISRNSVERTVSGLDGVLSIDLGKHGRKIKQKGLLRAKSQLQIDGKIGAISQYMDGDTHTLVTGSGEQFDNLRMDIFKVTEKRVSGDGLAIDYEIVYTQLNV